MHPCYWGITIFNSANLGAVHHCYIITLCSYFCCVLQFGADLLAPCVVYACSSGDHLGFCCPIFELKGGITHKQILHHGAFLQCTVRNNCNFCGCWFLGWNKVFESISSIWKRYSYFKAGYVQDTDVEGLVRRVEVCQMSKFWLDPCCFKVCNVQVNQMIRKKIIICIWEAKQHEREQKMLREMKPAGARWLPFLININNFHCENWPAAGWQ